MDLGDRMKNYENTLRQYLTPRMPVIMRIDGKAFHSLTRKCKKPFDVDFASAMDCTARKLLNEIQNSRMAYVQSDEISILLIDYNTFQSQQWFGGNIQKMVSVSASISGVEFSQIFGKNGYFDSRVFILPKNDIVNYVIWRQQDCTRNSVSSVAQSLYSPKQLHQKSNSKMQDMIFDKGINWNNYESYWKRGRIILKDNANLDIPIFSQDRKYIEKFMEIEEE